MDILTLGLGLGRVLGLELRRQDVPGFKNTGVHFLVSGQLRQDVADPLCNWNILTLTGKELELVEEAKQYHFDIIGVSLTKRCGSGTVDLDGCWKLFYSGADPT